MLSIVMASMRLFVLTCTDALGASLPRVGGGYKKWANSGWMWLSCLDRGGMDMTIPLFPSLTIQARPINLVHPIYSTTNIEPKA